MVCSTNVDLFTDIDAVLNVCHVDCCLKWTLILIYTLDFMKEYEICLKCMSKFTLL